MNISYSKKNLINCTEGCTIGTFFKSGNGIVTFNKNILKFYYLNKENIPIFLYDKLLLENVLQIETYKFDNYSDGIFVLFESTKMCSINFVDDFPVVNSLKYFERDEYDIRHEDKKFFKLSRYVGISKISRRFFSIFAVEGKRFPAQVYKFIDIDDKIKNVIDIVFLTNYTVPTFCLVYNSTPRSYINPKNCQVIISSYDTSLNTFYVLDEYEVSYYTNKVLFHNNILIFVSPNDLIFKSVSNFFHLPLNKMSIYSKENMENIVLKDAQFFFRNEHLIIFNGDGFVYYIRLIIDSERIVDIEIKKLEYLVIPKYINEYQNLIMLGSNEKSFLFEISYDKLDDKNVKDEEIKKMRYNVDELSKIINEEYEKIYGTSIESNLKTYIYFNKIHEFSGIGYINDLCVCKKGDYIAVSEGVKNYILQFTDFYNFDIKKKLEYINYENIFAINEFLFLEKNEKLVKLSLKNFLEVEGDNLPNNSSTVLVKNYKEHSYQITNLKIIYYENYNKTIEIKFEEEITSAKFSEYDGKGVFGLLTLNKKLLVRDLHMNVITNLENVINFTFYQNYCITNVGDDLIFFNLFDNQDIRKINNIVNLDLIYYFNDKVIKTSEDKLVEIECIKLQKIDFLFTVNSKGFFAVYKIIEERLLKVFIDSFIFYDLIETSKFFFVLQDFVYINSKNPYFCYANKNGELFFYKSKYKMKNFLLHQNDIIFLTENKLCIAAYPKLDNKISIKKSDLFRNINDYNDSIIYDRYIFKKVILPKIPKNVEVSGNYILVVGCQKVKFKESEFDDSFADVYTYLYSIDLYTKCYKFMSSFELDSDEYVFDIKELFLNDSIGKDGKSKFIVVCITKIEGEDKHSRGRLVILELIDIVTDKKNKFKDKKLKLIASENIKGCIIKCDEIKGNIIVVLGIKTMVYKIDRCEGLIPIGIHDLHTLSTSLVTIKNYVLSSDIYRGLSFFYYQKRPVRLNLICTSNPIEYATHVDFIVKDTILYIICVDVKGNIHGYTYSPKNILSCDGTKFVKRCETNFNLGKLIMKKSNSKFINPIFISDSNYLIEINTIDESLYSKLYKVQKGYLSEIKDTFGLNPECFIDQENHLKSPSIKKPILREFITRLINQPSSEIKKYLENDFDFLYDLE